MLKFFGSRSFFTTKRGKQTPTIPRTKYHCSFCGKAQEYVQRLIAGPGVYICNECIVRIAGESDEARGANAERCSFCGKTQQQTLYIKGGPGQVAICNECIALCQEIFAEHP